MKLYGSDPWTKESECNSSYRYNLSQQPLLQNNIIPICGGLIEIILSLGPEICSLMNPAPGDNDAPDSGLVSYLPSINSRLLSITRYNGTRNFITPHGGQRRC